VGSVTQAQDWELVTLMWWACGLRQVPDGASADGLDCDRRGLRDVVFDTYILNRWHMRAHGLLTTTSHVGRAAPGTSTV